ncbi:MAG: hypothetical protein V1734_06240 [Nanoarchaeota archaeon]
MKEEFLHALQEVRKASSEKPRKFEQTVDLIINLRDFDARKQSLSLFVPLPHKAKEVKICAFLDKQSSNFDFCITKSEMDRWQDKKTVKKLSRDYDFFVALASLMPKIATQFGRTLGPTGKMPSPQLGILASQDEAREKELAGKIRMMTRIKAKEPSLKIVIGMEKMPDESIVENANTIFNAVVHALPKGMDNIKSVMIKFTMSKPAKVKFK